MTPLLWLEKKQSHFWVLCDLPGILMKHLLEKKSHFVQLLPSWNLKLGDSENKFND